jgi:transposase InsO family protein
VRAAPSHLERGAAFQKRRRERERRLRRHTVAVTRWAGWRGIASADVADAIGVAPRTLARWCDEVGKPAAPLGAPPNITTPSQRRAISDFLDLWGSTLGVPTLRDHFPGLPTGELARLIHLHRFRRYRDDRMQSYCACTWTSIGSVWAIDYTQPPVAIDGEFRSLLCVRDLASGCMLLALPCRSADAATTVAALVRLFAEHGRPLVLKSDNGSHFTADLVRDLLNLHSVTLLLSPPDTPRYNGACEAGLGALKTRTHHLAARDGDPAVWTCNHVEAARLQANRVDVAKRGTTPEQRFASRAPISDQDRQRFLDAVAARAQQRWDGLARTNHLPRPSFDVIRRQATTDALLGTGLLYLRRRPVRQPLPSYF